MTVRAYSYLRISTDTQQAGDGVRRQLDASKRYAESKGYDLVESIQDIGVSGFRGKNSTDGAFAHFLSAIESGEVEPGSVLIIESLDRLSRDGATKAFSQFAGILSKGVKIVTLMDGQEYTEEGVNTNPGQLFTSLGVMIRANEESATKSVRLQAAWAQKRSNINEKKLTRRIPAWLTLSEDRKSFIVDDAAANSVRKIFELCVSGVGAFSITRLLNGDPAEHPPISSSAIWNKSYVMKILRNRAVLGEFQPQKMRDGVRVSAGKLIKDYYPQIISEETFLLAKRSLRERRTGGAGRKGKLHSNLFTNLAKCGLCGGSMNFRNKGQPPKGGTYLHCYSSVSNSGCRQPPWRYSQFEAAFFQFVNEISFSDILDKGTPSELKRWEDQLSAFSEKQTDLQLQLAQLYDRMTALETTTEVFNALATRAEQLNRDLAELSDDIVSLKQKIAQHQLVSPDEEQQRFMDDFSSLSNEMDEIQLRTLRSKIHGRLMRFIDKIELHNGFRLEPWEVQGNISASFLVHLKGRGIESTTQIESFLDSEHGQREFDKHERYFVVKFKNGVVKFVRPSLAQSNYWISSKLADLIESTSS